MCFSYKLFYYLLTVRGTLAVTFDILCQMKILNFYEFLSYYREVIQGAERYGAPEENLKERKKNRSCYDYVALLCDFIDK